jgi:tripartite-type tricarboxylate transporter receptor subunit TctC
MSTQPAPEAPQATRLQPATVRRRTLLAGAGALAALGAPTLRAQGWPGKPVRVVVGFPPGGVADVMARTIQPALQESLGQPVVIENRGGANGNIAADAVAKSPADGYSLVVCTTGVETVNPLLTPSTTFIAQRDLTHVAMLGRIQLFLTTRQGLPPTTLAEFMSYARANPGKLSYGSAGSGSTPHLAGELFKQAAGIFATHIPYRGAAPALQDLLAGQIDFCFDPGIAFPYVRSGRLKMLAVASGKRSAYFPNVPTVGEGGFKGVEADTLFGVYAPAGTPAEVVARLNRDFNRALSQPLARERFATVGGEPTPMSPAEFKAAAAKEAAIFGPIIQARRITPD